MEYADEDLAVGDIVVLPAVCPVAFFYETKRVETACRLGDETFTSVEEPADFAERHCFRCGKK